MSQDDIDQAVVRRRFLQLTGLGAAGGASALAGCTGGGDESTTTEETTTAADTTSDDETTTATTTEADVAPSGEVVLSQTYDPITLDPAKYSNITDMQIANNVFDALTDYELGTADLGPGLATDWSFTEDGQSLEFSLREGVQFHKGYGELTAADVEAHFDRMNDPDAGSPQKAALDQVGYQGIEVEGDYAFRLNFDQPPTPVPFLVGQAMGMIPSADAVDEKGQDFGFDPVGAGPFEFVTFEPQTKTELAAFDDYYRDGRPKVARSIWRPIPEAQTAWSSFRAGEIDVKRVNSAERLQQLRGQDDVEIQEAVGLITRFAGFNCQVEPFTDVRVRQALNYGANQAAISEAVFPGMSEPAGSFVAPGVKYQTTDGVPEYPYDPDQATSLLEEAGYGDGFETTWWVPNIGRFTEPAQVFQNNWSEIGVDVEIQIKEVGAYVSRIFQGEHDVPMFIHSLGQDPVPDSFMYDSFHSGAWPPNGSNYWLYENGDVDGWLEDVVSTTDDDARAELFTNVERTVTDEAPGIWIDHEKFIFPTKDYVDGFVSDPMRRMELDETSVNR